MGSDFDVQEYEQISEEEIQIFKFPLNKRVCTMSVTFEFIFYFRDVFNNRQL